MNNESLTCYHYTIFFYHRKKVCLTSLNNRTIIFKINEYGNIFILQYLKSFLSSCIPVLKLLQFLIATLMQHSWHLQRNHCLQHQLVQILQHLPHIWWVSWWASRDALQRPFQNLLRSQIVQVFRPWVLYVFFPMQTFLPLPTNKIFKNQILWCISHQQIQEPVMSNNLDFRLWILCLALF